jgi:hypothetical protein
MGPFGGSPWWAAGVAMWRTCPSLPNSRWVRLPHGLVWGALREKCPSGVAGGLDPPLHADSDPASQRHCFSVGMRNGMGRPIKSADDAEGVAGSAENTNDSGGFGGCCGERLLTAKNGDHSDGPASRPAPKKREVIGNSRNSASLCQFCIGLPTAASEIVVT